MCELCEDEECVLQKILSCLFCYFPFFKSFFFSVITCSPSTPFFSLLLFMSLSALLEASSQLLRDSLESKSYSTPLTYSNLLLNIWAFKAMNLVHVLPFLISLRLTGLLSNKVDQIPMKLNPNRKNTYGMQDQNKNDHSLKQVQISDSTD